MDDWLRCNPGRTISIYELGSLTGQAFNLAMTPGNILSGFRSTGISPLHTDIFTDQDFLPSDVSDRPEQTTLSAVTPHIAKNISSPSAAPIPSPSAAISSATTSVATATETASNTTTYLTSVPPIISPESILPLPKAIPRRMNSRKRRKAAIITDTPHKEQLAKERQKGERQRKGKKKFPDSSSSEEDADLAVPLSTDSESADECCDSNDQQYGRPTPESLVKGAHILVKYTTKRKTSKYYAGVIEEVLEDEELKVSYLRKKGYVCIS